jgi:hypothetical protein
LITFISLTAILSGAWVIVEDLRAKYGYLHIEGHTEYIGRKQEQEKEQNA